MGNANITGIKKTGLAASQISQKTLYVVGASGSLGG